LRRGAWLGGARHPDSGALRVEQIRKDRERSIVT